MQKQKAVFDRKLQEQEEKNREVVKDNAKIAQNIMKLAALGVIDIDLLVIQEHSKGVKWAVFNSYVQLPKEEIWDTDTMRDIEHSWEI